METYTSSIKETITGFWGVRFCFLLEDTGSLCCMNSYYNLQRAQFFTRHFLNQSFIYMKGTSQSFSVVQMLPISRKVTTKIPSKAKCCETANRNTECSLQIAPPTLIKVYELYSSSDVCLFYLLFSSINLNYYLELSRHSINICLMDVLVY